MEAFGYYGNDERRILIIGGGTIGRNLAMEIESSQNNILIKMIEKDMNRCEVAAKQLQKTEILIGDALDYEILLEANVQKSETVVAITNDDKVNILSSLLAKKSGASRVLTLLNNMHYASLVTSLGVDAVISPRALTVSTILRQVRKGKIRTAHAMVEGNAVMIEATAKETNNVMGLSVEDLTISGKVVIAALIRDGVVNIAPTRMVISSGDDLVIFATKESVQKVEKLFSIRPSYL
jgi:trk system potassium uptake protein TrkA